MPTPYEIPLSPNPQRFSVDLAGVTYNLTFTWNTILNCWMIAIADSNNIPIVSSIPVVTGADLLAPYPYLNFGGKLVATTDGNFDEIPTFENLGLQSHLYFVTPT